MSDRDTPRHGSTSVAIIGAGLAGLAAASSLEEHGLDCVVLDKARGPGGRGSTRREEHAGRTLHFDHGAQYFTIRDPDFERFVQSLPVASDLPGEEREPLVREWTAPVVALENGSIKGRSENTRRFVFAPGMNALPRFLAQSLRCHFTSRVARCERVADRWHLYDDDGTLLLDADTLVVTAPAPQTLALLPEEAPLRARLSTVRYAPAWTIMAWFPQSLEQPFGGAFVDGSELGWVANNDSKPGRRGFDAEGECWVMHGTPEWSYVHQEAEPEAVIETLLASFGRALGRGVPEPGFVKAHRWRFALPTMVAGSPCLWDPSWRLGIAGDGCPQGARVEGAFVSGRALARHIRRASGATA